jgi:fructose-1,6-bisphosphatase I
VDRSVVTLNRFIVEREREHPEARGEFSGVLQDLTLAAKLVDRAVRKAGLVDVLGETGAENVHGERVRKLDEYAHDVVVAAMDHGGHLCVMGSEESEGLIPIPDRHPVGDYVLLFDPLDGSGNIDAGLSVGTIFSILERRTDPEDGRDGRLEDCLQPGRRQAAAGYVLYGASTVLVYTTGDGVHGFTLDPSIGEFVLSHPDIAIPEPGQRIYSVNEGHWNHWSEEQRALVRRLKEGPPEGEGAGGEARGLGSFSHRYVGSLVADVHRTLSYGGLFMYPANRMSPEGKLRLLYEAAPMAMLVEEAGGAAVDGRRRIADVEPEALHQRTPLFLGSRSHVELARAYVGGDGA